MLRNKVRGQATAEYVVILGLVVGAVIAMQVYIRRGLQARVKEATDYTVNPVAGKFEFNGHQQYEPYYFHSDIERKQASRVIKDLYTDKDAQQGRGVYEKQIVNQAANITGSQTVDLGRAHNDN